ncbi:putative bifunctional diguanylate cyclase/phosphodiesterase [Spongisporangium articulatum]|uniref:Bifunctional diguanylate cyclase/phosphodiesterase n=1 Tax=Spongisporangium articulatum TaxID=3362603 RepID=A0ABW8ANN2_9ACTN
MALRVRLRLLIEIMGAKPVLSDVSTVTTSLLLVLAVSVPLGWITPLSVLVSAVLAVAVGLLVTILTWTVRPPAQPPVRTGTTPVLTGTSIGLGALSATILLATFGGDRLHAFDGGIVLLTLASLWWRESLRLRTYADLVQKLSALATTDPLTGLGNRRALAAAIEHDLLGGHSVTVITVDLDHFKDVNTLLGHHAGDDLLAAVADALRREGGALRTFRLGGDEFAVLAIGTFAKAVELGHRLLARVNDVARSLPGTGQVDLSASAGIAHRPAGSPELPDAVLLLNRSGEAMRAAKSSGRDRMVTFDDGLARRQHRLDAVERRLRAAVADDGVALHVQPVVDLQRLEMVGGEMLARWFDDELGFVPPDEFIPVAEDRGLIVELGLQLTRRAMSLWQDSGAAARGLSGGINISVAQLRRPGFAAQVADLLDELELEPGRIVLEVTESLQIEDDDPAVGALWQLSDLGLSVAMDDFGTGFASLGLLTRLPLRVLKLDRSLTSQLGDARGSAVARAVTEMAHALGIDVVAEGIETAEQLAAAQALGVGFGQGWLFEKAVPPERFTELMREPDWVRRQVARAASPLDVRN